MNMTALESVVHDTLREVLQQINDNFGIRVESVSIDWGDELPTVINVMPRSVIHQVKVISATTKGKRES